MTTILTPICASCELFESRFDLGAGEEQRPFCAAFPQGIPDEIFVQGFDHRELFEGDQGIRWTFRRGARALLDAYEQSRALRG